MFRLTLPFFGRVPSQVHLTSGKSDGGSSSILSELGTLQVCRYPFTVFDVMYLFLFFSGRGAGRGERGQLILAITYIIGETFWAHAVLSLSRTFAFLVSLFIFLVLL